ncbi:PilZ domain-containing protein [uncultured Paludibaculum sp.]|uniref:PilZ domain-containing protein n=1 Tax=uncultured Paludibaculum sp. TaxID=1765020 RepID=UPI00374CAFFE
MERRLSPRWAVDLDTTVTLLGDSELELPARVQDLSVQGARILLERPLPAGTCVKLVLEDCLYLGEVAYCRQLEEGFQAGLVLEHAIHSLSDLHSLMQSPLAQSATPHRDYESRQGRRSTARR